jgi:hypothetical protein
MQIIDDFLPHDQFIKLQNNILYDLPWYWVEHVSRPGGKPADMLDPMAMETDGLNHMVYDREFNTRTNTFDFFIDFFKQLNVEFGYDFSHLIRARLGMKTPRVGFTEQNYNLPHVDYYYPHDTIIYYLNDCDGDTRIFEPVFNSLPEPTMFATKQRITPKANRMILFNGLQYHTASNPINSSRRVIFNVNLLPLVSK